ncbi:DUF1707 and DUF4190 domain-containing protein [Streptomyces sp. GSL17-111]|uniref:DUF1707 and DUF4190 domain-containing protein n=1 Tax=Streptomyces sp. GSL17-111 TaxID=3121596 RepID=UPI0030F380FF
MSLNWPGGSQPYGGQPYGGQPFMRASDADRERAADVLKAGYAEGRLPKEEYEARLHRIHEASTYAEMQPLIADLPQGPVPAPAPTPYQRPVEPTYHITPPRYSPYPVHPMRRPPETSGWATAALVCACLVPAVYITALPAVICGHVARADIRRTGKEGNGFATAGIVVGYVAMGFAALIALFAVALSV